MRSSPRLMSPNCARHRQRTMTALETLGARSTRCSRRFRHALFTLRAVACLSKVQFMALELDAPGTVDRQDGVTRFTEIVLRLRLTVPSGTDREQALHVLEESKKTCWVSASLATPIRLEPEITEQE